jgi:hypothetical protein
MPASTSYFLPGVVFVPPPLSSVFYCVVLCLRCCPVCSVCSVCFGAIQNFNQNFNLLILKSGRYLTSTGMVVLRYRYRLINYSEHCLFTISLLLILGFTVFVYCKNSFTFLCAAWFGLSCIRCGLLPRIRDSGCTKLILIFSLKLYLSEFLMLIALL